MGQAWFGAALGESPAPASAGLDQQELDDAAAEPVAYRCNLFAVAHSPELRDSNGLSAQRGWADPR